MNRRWQLKVIPNPNIVDSLQNLLRVNSDLCAILVQRGITDFQSAKDYFRPELAQLHDPFLMLGMHSAVERLMTAIERQEKILIYGDYDVDGTTAVALVYKFLKPVHHKLEYYIPNRHTEGYGLSKEGIQFAHENQFQLVISLDCGIKSIERIAEAKQLGIDFIVCDHHLPGETLPEAWAILDPKQEGCNYPYKELSGCGVGFKFMQALAHATQRNPAELFQLLDLVAVSIASDIVPITGENRILAHYGLKLLNENPCYGLKALMECTQAKPPVDISAIVFILGPRINAAGRINHASTSVDLFIAETYSDAQRLAGEINATNTDRQKIDERITTEALEMIQSNPASANLCSTVLYNESWNKGVIGIVASRCIEKFYRPTVILTSSNGSLVGSARSIYGFDLYSAIEQCADLLEKFGGHRFAAGLTLTPGNLEAFKRRFEQVVASRITPEMTSPVLEIDHVISLKKITTGFFRILKQMAPFGPENNKPVFMAENLLLLDLKILKERHIKLKVTDDATREKTMDAIGFDMADSFTDLTEKFNANKVAKSQLTSHSPVKIDLAFTIEENSYQEITSLQLRIKDIRQSYDT